MRWIYNLKKMLDKKQKEVVLATPQEDGVYRDTINGELYEFEQNESPENDEEEEDDKGKL